ncbi:MAG: amidohydrolase family protein, partial [Flavisolibacter sp.]
MKMIHYLLIIFFFITACNSQSKADLIVFNAKIYTVDSAFSVAEAMAIKDGRIVEVGSTSSITAQYTSDHSIDVQGRIIYPGFIDAHAHFYRYGLGLQTADLFGTTSWDEILDRLEKFSISNTNGWIIGRGWDQNDWAIKEFPSKELLDTRFPDRPVYLVRVDGHAA